MGLESCHDTILHNLTLTTLPHLLCLSSPEADFIFGEKRDNVLLQNTYAKIKGNILSPKSLWEGEKRWTATTLISPTQGVSSECPAKANALWLISRWAWQATQPPHTPGLPLTLTTSTCWQDSNPPFTFHQGKCRLIHWFGFMEVFL